MYFPIRLHLLELRAESMEAMSLFVPLCHDVMIITITLQLMLIALLLLYKMWRAFLHWRKGVVFSSTLVPTLDQLVPLPHPNPVLLWDTWHDTALFSPVGFGKSGWFYGQVPLPRLWSGI